MTTPLLLGLVAGVGGWAIVFGLTTRQPPLAKLNASLQNPNWPAETEVSASRWQRAMKELSLILVGATPTTMSNLSADLQVLDRSVEAHVADKARTALFMASLPLGTWMVAAGSGVRFPATACGAAVVACAVGGWILSDVQARSRASDRRKEFRSTLVTYLQLVTILLAGGSGIQQALREATEYGHGWSFTVIARSLNESRSRNMSPWVGFTHTADRLKLAELAELAGAMQLAGESGAQVRESLMAKAESLRVHELTEIEADAASKTERMGAPIALLFAGFVVMVGYPGFAKILAL